MNKYIFYPLLLLAALLLLTTCPKSEPAPKSLIKEKLLKSWKAAKVSQVGKDTPIYLKPLAKR